MVNSRESLRGRRRDSRRRLDHLIFSNGMMEDMDIPSLFLLLLLLLR